MTPILPELWRHLSRWRGYTYGDLDYAARTIDCSALTASVLRDHYGPEVVDRDVWAALNLSRAEHRARPWAPVEAIAEALDLHPVHPHVGPERPEPGRLHLCQGWRYLTTEGVGPGSQGHAWLWLSFGGWLGVCIESSGVGPRVWDGHGRRPLADVVSAGGEIVAELHPLDWAARAGRWTSGVAWVALP